MQTQETLKQRFKATWSSATRSAATRSAATRSSATDDNAESVCAALFDSLNGPKRYYHGPEHVRHCLLEFDRIADQLESTLAVELAIWFHDYIYHSESGEDEHESAAGFATLASSILDPELIATVRTLIIATAHHGQIEQADPELAFLLDVDLASLGGDWDQFMADGSALRKEEPELGDHQYYRNKIGFFNILEGLDRIYKSDFFHQMYEQSARSNLQRHRRWLEQEMPDIFT